MDHAVKQRIELLLRKSAQGRVAAERPVEMPARIKATLTGLLDQKFGKPGNGLRKLRTNES